MTVVVSNLIRVVENLKARVNSLEFVTNEYYEWKSVKGKEKKKFEKHIREKVEKLREDRAKADLSSK